MNREKFESWYIEKYLAKMTDAEKAMADLRNDSGGYDNDHIDGAWSAFKSKSNISALYMFDFVVFMMSVTGLLYLVCFYTE